MNYYHLLGAQEQGLSTQVSSLVSVSRVNPSPQWYNPALTQHIQLSVSSAVSAEHKQLLSQSHVEGSGRDDRQASQRHRPHSPQIIDSDGEDRGGGSTVCKQVWGCLITADEWVDLALLEMDLGLGLTVETFPGESLSAVKHFIGVST